MKKITFNLIPDDTNIEVVIGAIKYYGAVEKTLNQSLGDKHDDKNFSEKAQKYLLITMESLSIKVYGCNIVISKDKVEFEFKIRKGSLGMSIFMECTCATIYKNQKYLKIFSDRLIRKNSGSCSVTNPKEDYQRWSTFCYTTFFNTKFLFYFF